MPRPKALTRKEISKDRIRFLLVETWERVIEYRNYLLVGVATAILGGIGFWGFDAFQTSRIKAAQEELAGALNIFNTVVPDAKDQAQADGELPYTSNEARDEQALRRFRQIADQHDWSVVGELARFYVGVTQRRLKHYQESRESFREIVNQSSRPEMRNLARNHVALLSLYLDQRPQAIEAWNQILDDSSSHIPTLEIISNLAKTYEAAGQKTEALALFKRLKDEHPWLPNAASIEARIALLESEIGSGKESAPPSEDAEAAPSKPGENGG